MDLIGELEVEMLLFSQKGDVVVQGDFNARTGDMQETILDDDNAFLNVPEDYEVDELYKAVARLRHYKFQRSKLIRNLHCAKFANSKRKDCW